MSRSVDGAEPPAAPVAVLHELVAFDELLDAGTDLATLVGLAARLLGRTVAVRSADGRSLAADLHGPCAVPGPDAGTARSRRLPDGTDLWVTGGAHGPGTDVVLRRLALAVRSLTLEAVHSQAADVRQVIDPHASDEDRLPALRRLGLRGGSSVTVLALAGPVTAVDVLVGRVGAAARPVQHLVEDRVHLVLAHELPAVTDLDVPVGVRCAHSRPVPARLLPDAWRRARNALRFALPSSHPAGPYTASESVFVDADVLGAWSLLAERLTIDDLGRVGDVRRLEQLLTESGPDMLTTLLAVAGSDSLRRAAREVHVHHNSVAHRVQRAEKALGFSLSEPFGRGRLLLTLTLHRLLESRRLF